jgi:hypothetical protein
VTIWNEQDFTAPVDCFRVQAAAIFYRHRFQEATRNLLHSDKIRRHLTAHFTVT